MNANYDMTSLLQKLHGIELDFQTKSNEAYAHEINEARDVIHRQFQWIKKARPALYELRQEAQAQDRISSTADEACNVAAQLNDGWLPPSTHQVSFDGINWIDLPYDKQVPASMLSREKK